MEEAEHRWLPDFCSLPVIAALLLVAELVFLVVQFAPGDSNLPSLAELAAGSLFVEWLALCCALALCKLRGPLTRVAPTFAPALAYLAVVAIVAAGSALVFHLDQVLGTRLTLAQAGAQRFIGGCVAVSALVAAAAFRYFYVQAQWQRQIRAQARAQIAALQARIRPHFLFNSMNTIASLIRSRPDAAERAVEDLSDLFRAALKSGDEPSRIEVELELARRYLDIEQLRLGSRLKVTWALETLPESFEMPALLLQPLIENAVHHGIQPLPEGGTIEISGGSDAREVTIAIRNPCAPVPARLDGNRIALDNIRQRLAYHYGTRASLETEQGADYYACRLKLPRA
jgi:two-component system sensor histidine kinase AlgZ